MRLDTTPNIKNPFAISFQKDDGTSEQIVRQQSDALAPDTRQQTDR